MDAWFSFLEIVLPAIAVCVGFVALLSMSLGETDVTAHGLEKRP